jgi:uncharacterized membrane protein
VNTEPVWTLLLVSHVVAATVSVLLGVVQLARRKGDLPHRVLGRVWVVLMLWAAVTSYWIRHIRDGEFSWLHVLSLVTLVTVTLGVVAVRRGDVAGHRGHMTGSWLGSLGAMVFALALPERMLPTYAVEEPVGMVAAIGSVVVATAGIVVLGRVCARFAPLDAPTETVG